MGKGIYALIAIIRTGGKVNGMRLIDADTINFEEVFGGKSDFAKDLRKAAQELIDIQPTAFDKEKIIEKLRKWENESVDNRDWNHGDGLIDLCEIHEHHGARRAYKHAIEIVEKGGIE